MQGQGGGLARKGRRVRVGAGVGLSMAALAGLGSLQGTAAGATAQKGHAKPFAGKTLTILGFTSAGTNNPPAYAKYYAAVAAKFKQVTGATLKPVVASPDEGTLNQQIQQLAVSHSGEDMYAVGSTLGPTLFYSGAFVRLSKAQWNEIGGENQFYPNQLGDAGRKGLYSFVPMYNVPDAMVYNTKLFKQAGISKPPSNWTQYVQDAQKINDPSKGIYGTAMDPGDSTDPWKTLWFMVKGYGGDYVSANDTKATIATSPVKNAVNFWFSWNYKFHIVNPASLTWDSSQMEAAFAQGDVGEEIVQKSLDIPVYKSGPAGSSFAFAPMPCTPYGLSKLPKNGSCPGTFLSADGFGISKYGNVPLALQLIKIVLEPKYQAMYYRLTGGLPVTTVAGAQVERANPTLVKPFVSALSSQQPTPFVGAWGTIEATMASVASKSAAQVASSNSLPNSSITSTLQAANEAVQQQLK